MKLTARPLPVLSIDPALRHSGIVIASPRVVHCATTLDFVGDLEALASEIPIYWDRIIRPWLEAEGVQKAVIELPPPRTPQRRYQLEPAVAAGLWLAQAGRDELWVELVPAWTWQRAMLGPKRSWHRKSAKGQAKLKHDGAPPRGVQIVGDHQIDAYWLSQWWFRAGRLARGG